MIRKLLLFITAITGCLTLATAQVTTSSLTGEIRVAEGETLPGATITITHVPTGTSYKVVAGETGRFTVDNLPAGGPYTVTSTFIGYKDALQENIQVGLGEKKEVILDMTTDETVLAEVVISARAREEKVGTATNLGREQIVNLPNINRSLLDVTKLTPQANGSSFMGMSNQFNNITVDGSVFNNNFGLGGNPLPGGASQPISIDAIDQMQINIAPYDVRQTGFTGAGINAVTRRGTNNLYLTVYDYYRNQNFNGKKADGQKLPASMFRQSTSNIIGGSVGGAIVKNKLFFFLNGEYERVTRPGQNSVVNTGPDDENPNRVENVNAEMMDNMANFLKETYQYDPGIYQGYRFARENSKFLARLDWNLSAKHRLTLRYNQAKTSDDVLTNTSSGPNPRISNGRNGGRAGGLNFANANYKQNNNVYSVVAELNSQLGSKASNQLLASFTRVHDFRSTPGEQFPFVDIMRDPSNVLMSFGSEIYSYQNYVKNNTWNISDNFSLNLDRHSLLAGVSFDYMTFANSFANFGGQSYYRFNSMEEFMEGAAPSVFALTYSNADPNSIAPAEATFAQLGIYLQDVFSVSNRFKLTYGARFDLPFYPGNEISNDALSAIDLRDPDGNSFRADVGAWPKARLLISPRVGFIYNVDNTLTVRGGTGIFTGRIPFVWLVNQSSDNGVLNSQVTFSGSEEEPLNDYLFNPDRTMYAPKSPSGEIGILPGAYYSVTSSDFKIPQTWRSNLAVDKELGNDVVATIEGIYSKTINAVYHYNANLGGADSSRSGFGGDTRNVFHPPFTDEVGQVFVMDNNSLGHSLALTAQLQKRFSNNWGASVAYTYSAAKDVSPNNGARSQSGWTQNAIINNPNRPELGYSVYAVPHRINAYGSYRLEYANKNLASTFTLFYSGSSQGRYLYRYSGDVNGDGATNDLLFVPATRQGLDEQFAELIVTNSDDEETVFSPGDQADAFWSFVENDKYLNKKKGQYVDRFGAMLPWVNDLDLRFLQDFAPMIGNRRHTLQLSLDIINVLNLLNSSWGNQYTFNYGGFSDQPVLGVRDGLYTFNPSNSAVFRKDIALPSTWSMQVGLRYIF